MTNTVPDAPPPSRLTNAEFEARGLARSRYHDKLFAASKPRPTNDQFDEGWEAARQFYTRADIAARSPTWEDGIKRGREQLAAELLGQLDRCASTTAAFHLVKSLCLIESGVNPNTLGALDEKA